MSVRPISPSSTCPPHERLRRVCWSVKSVMAKDDDDRRSLSPLMLDDSLSSSSQLDSPRFTHVRFTSKRRRFVITVVAIFSVLSLLAFAYHSSSRPLLVSQDSALPLNHTPSEDRKSALLGPPTRRFRGLP